MKLRASNPFRPHLLALAALLAASSVHAADGTWNGISGNWSDTTISGGVWSGGIFADLIDFNANFTGVDIAADQIITLDAARTIGNITFTDLTTSSNNLTISGANILTLDRSSGAPLIDVTQTGRTLTISSQISGADGLQKNGTGTLSLSGPNDYTGTTAISNGILAISNATALGSSVTGNTTIVGNGLSTGPQLSLSGNINSAENITLTGNTDQNQYNAVIYNTSGINTLSGNVTLANPAGNIRISSGGGELIFAGSFSQTTSTKTLILQASTGASLTVNNAIANNNGTLTIIGFYGGGASNGVTLKAASTAIGATTVMENGLLKLGVTNALKTNANLTLGVAQNFVGNGGFDYGKFDLAGFNQTVNALVGTKNTGNTIGADSNRIVTNSAASGTNLLTVGNGNGSGTFNGVILDGATAAVALTKTGTGTQTLSTDNLGGSNNYSGVTTISAGTLVITHGNALGSTAGNTTIAATGNTNGGLLQISNNITSPENITITGTTEQNSYISAILSTGGNNTLSGNITLNPSAGGGMRLGSSSGSLTFSGNISQTGTSQGLALFASNGTSITFDNAIANNGGPLAIYNATQSTGTGTVTFKGVSGAGIGETNINQTGILKLGVTDALNTSANLILGTASNVTGFDHGTFDLAGYNQTVNALIGTANTSGTIGANDKRKITNSAVGTGTNTLTVGNNNAFNPTFNGVIVDGATAKVALIKTGTGTQTLAGVNTYSGDTTVSGGTLTLNNPNANNQTSTVTIAASGALLKLNFAATDTVEKLFIGATQQAIGEYGHTDSGATNGGAGVGAKDAWFAAGTGKLNVTTGPGGGSPEIAIAQGGDIANGGSKGFGTVTTGSNTSLIFTITNSGTAALNLSGSPLVAVSGTNAADFTVTATPTTPVTSGGGTTTFTVQFAPGAAGARSAVLTIANDDSDEGTFTINVSGTGQTPYEAWASGALFDADANGDGVDNGLAFLLGAANPNDSALSLLPTVTHSSGNLILTFNMRNSANRGSAAANVQHSSDLGISDAWEAALVPDADSTVNDVVFDITAGSPVNGVQATIPASKAASGKLFGRLKATNP